MDFFGPTMIFILLGLSILYIVYGMKKLRDGRRNGQEIMWYQQFYMLLGGLWFIVALLDIILLIHEAVHNEISNIVLLIAMVMFVIMLTIILVLIYKSRRYLRQQQNQPQAK